MLFLPPTILNTKAYAINENQKERVPEGTIAVFIILKTKRGAVKEKAKAKTRRRSRLARTRETATTLEKLMPARRNTRHDQDQIEDERRAKVKEDHDHRARVQESRSAERGIKDLANSQKKLANMVTRQHAQSGHPQKDATGEPNAGFAITKQKVQRLLHPAILRNRRKKRNKRKRPNLTLRSDRIAKAVKAAKAATNLKRRHDVSDAQHQGLERANAT